MIRISERGLSPDATIEAGRLHQLTTRPRRCLSTLNPKTSLQATSGPSSLSLCAEYTCNQKSEQHERPEVECNDFFMIFQRSTYTNFSKLGRILNLLSYPITFHHILTSIPIPYLRNRRGSSGGDQQRGDHPGS